MQAKTSRVGCGSIDYILVNSRRAAVESTENAKTATSVTELVATLDDQTRVVLRKTKSKRLPEGIDGVLDYTEESVGNWRTHSSFLEYVAPTTVDDWRSAREAIGREWSQTARFKVAKDATPGLRPPQAGALHAIGAHWSLAKSTATIVMPTGTGKTEAMLATLAAYIPPQKALLVVVPTSPLLDQTAHKFETWGLLRELGVLPQSAKNPIVGKINRRPTSVSDLEIFDCCNVVVSTVAAVTQLDSEGLSEEIARRCNCLIVDEAHHTPASTWAHLKEQFDGLPILQFTATPFRRDGKPVEGKVIYTYPLRSAQADGYFKPIQFRPVFELDVDKADEVIARAALEQLASDTAAGHNHLIMARTATIERAKRVQEVYKSVSEESVPVLLHSQQSKRDKQEALSQLRARESKVIVCVDMLGEGFDYPNLKIAALHDVHKSLAPLLQFAGRFTRTGDQSLGDATAIANTALQDVNGALERLYAEDADWNILLREFATEAQTAHAALVQFLAASKRVDEPADGSMASSLSAASMRPKFSAAAFRIAQFKPHRFIDAFAEGRVQAAWVNEENNTVFFVTLDEPTLQWSRSKETRDREWHLYVLYYDPGTQLLYLHSSDKSAMHVDVAKAVGGGDVQLLGGDAMFRSLSNIKRLKFQMVGLKKHGRRNLRYSMYSGPDVEKALTNEARQTSTKSNVSGIGFENGHPVSIGCSYKGRFWSKHQGSIQEFCAWCASIGEKLVDDSIQTDDIIDNVLVPTEVDVIPDRVPIGILWPIEIQSKVEQSVKFEWTNGQATLRDVDLAFESLDRDNNRILFRVRTESSAGTYAICVGVGAYGHEVRHVSGSEYTSTVGTITTTLAEYLTDYPPPVLFSDGSELDGCLLIEPRTRELRSFPTDQLTTANWQGVDIRKESIFKDGARRDDSIQARTVIILRDEFDVVFDDDAAGEAADLVCIREGDDSIHLLLVHCKFTTSHQAGQRVKDVVDVSSQAVRSSSWIWDFKRLVKHLAARESQLDARQGATRFEKGNSRLLASISRAAKFKKVSSRIMFVQPGLSKSSMTVDQSQVLGAANNYLMETVNIPLEGLCSE